MRETNEIQNYITNFVGGAWDHGFSVERFRSHLGTLIAKRGRISIHVFTNEKDFGFARVFDRKNLVAEIINFNWRDAEISGYKPKVLRYVDHNHTRANDHYGFGHVLGRFHQDTPKEHRPDDRVIRIETCLFGLLIDAKLSLEPTVDPCSPDPGTKAILTNETFSDGSTKLAIILDDKLLQFTDGDDFVLNFWDMLAGVEKVDQSADGAVDPFNFDCVQIGN